MAGRFLPSGHITKEIGPEEKEEQIRDFVGYKRIYESNECFMRCYPEGWFLPSMFHNFSEQIYSFKFKPDDVIIMTYPKCGTTWTQEIVWTMVHNKNFDHPMTEMPAMAKVPFIEMDGLIVPGDLEGDKKLLEFFDQICPGKNRKDGIMWQIAENSPSPRIIKTHLSLSFYKKDLLQSCKIIYVVRNPKDVLMSFLHHHRLFVGHGFTGSFGQFFDYFLEDKIMFSPFWPHVREAWAKKDNPNMLFLFYENLKKNTKEEYKKISSFLNVNLTSEELDKIIEYTSFPVMKKREESLIHPDDSYINPHVLKEDGGFFRKGETGAWKNKLTPMQEARFNLWIKKNTIGTGLNFDLGDKK